MGEPTAGGSKGKGKKNGRNKTKGAQYRANKTREKNKIKRVLKSNGLKYALEWAAKNSISGVLNSMLRLSE